MKSFFELMKDYRGGHSEFQMDYFITQMNGGTLYGQYKQALRELNSRFDSLRSLYCRRESVEIDIDELKHKINFDNKNNQFKTRRLNLQLKEKLLELESLLISIRDCEREFKRFYQQACYMKDLLGELNEEKEKELEKEYWYFCIKEKVALDLSTTGQISSDVLNMIKYAHPDVSKKIQDELKNNINDIIPWYESKKDVFTLPENLPEIKMIEKEEILSLSFDKINNK